MTISFDGLPSHWGTTRLDWVATVNARIGWKALTAAEYQPRGYAFLATPNIKNREIDFANVNYISEFRYRESPELQLSEGDILLTKDGFTLGTVNIVRRLPHPATINGSIALLRPFGIHPDFLYYVIASSVIQGHIWSVKDGMDVLHLFQRDIKKFPIPLPPLDEQRRIANFLDIETARIDGMISLRRRQVDLVGERLTAHASQSTGRVQLRKPGRSQNGIQLRRALTFVQTGSTPANLNHSEIGGAGTDQLPWYTPAALDGWLTVSPAEKTANLESTVPVFPAGSILITGIGESLGKVGHLDHTATGNQQLTALATRGDVNSRFIAWQLWSAESEIREWAQYSRIRIINNDSLKSFPIYLPPKSEQDAIVAALDLRLSVVRKLRVSIQRFERRAAERRQALITAAVTGQFDVSTANGRNVTEGVAV